MSFVTTVANRYLWSKRSEAFISILTIISILGVAIGVMVLNLVMAVMTGFEHELRSKIINTDSHIKVQRVGGVIREWKEIGQQILSVEQVESVSPFIAHPAMARSESNAAGVLVRAFTEESSAANHLQGYVDDPDGVKKLFTPPTFMDLSLSGEVKGADLPGIIIGEDLARTLGARIGSVVSILSPQVQSSPFGLIPRYKRFHIVAVYSSGLSEYESTVVYLDLNAAQKFFKLQGSVSGFEVRVSNFETAPAVSDAIREKLLQTERGFYTRDWTETHKPLWDALALEKKVYFIILLLIVLMASFSIVSTLVMIVLEKRKDIAVLRTLGATGKEVGRIFRYQGAVIGAVGTLLGLLLGLVGALLLKEYGFPLDEAIWPVSELPVRIDPLNFVLTGIAAFIICCLATIYPASRASRLDPGELLRYE